MNSSRGNDERNQGRDVSMSLYFYIWNDEIIAHLAEHDVTQEDFEYVLSHPSEAGTSDSSGLPVVWGYTEDGRFLFAVYRLLDEITILPVTAYEVPEQRRKKKKRKK
jgi:hypothetical protein